MQPFERFKKLNTEGNLWAYILVLGKEKEVCDENVRGLIFEKFGFLPGNLLASRVLYRLRRQDYIKTERYKGKKAYSATKNGEEELEKMKSFCHDLLEKI